MAERLIHRVDIKEMQRRWDATRAAMEKEDIDSLVLYAYDRVYGGAVKYLTDYDVPLYSHMALFNKDGFDMIGHFDFGAPYIKPFAVYTDELKTNTAAPAFCGTAYSDHFFAQQAVDIIKKRGYKKVGFVGMSYIPAALYLYMTANLPGIEFADATRMVDEIKAIKSPYEIEEFKKVVRIHDQLMAAVPDFLRVGRTEREVSNWIRNIANDMFCKELNVMIGRAAGKPFVTDYPYQNDVIQPNDYVQVLIEVSGPTGIWGECGRMFSIGDVEPGMQKAFDDCVFLQDHLAAMSRPGVLPGDIFDELNKKLAEMGYLPECRCFAHSQSTNIVDSPAWVKEESMLLEENMFFAMHPTVVNDKFACYNCDNFLITKDATIRLNKTPLEIVCVEG